jgi:hypothetical protein
MFTLEQVVPYGRSFEEYLRMFDLNDVDLTRKIIGCGDGPAAFNAEATRRGACVVSCDPVYRFQVDQIRRRIDEACDQVILQTVLHADEFIWDPPVRNADELRKVRMTAMNLFLDDFEQGLREGRYVDAELPLLPYADGEFELGLCSHLLFLYSEQLGEEFHRNAIRELCRVAREVRIFPTTGLDSRESPHLEICIEDLKSTGLEATVQQVPYEFHRGANRILRIRR